jgi:hypothetical protein
VAYRTMSVAGWRGKGVVYRTMSVCRVKRWEGQGCGLPDHVSGRVEGQGCGLPDHVSVQGEEVGGARVWLTGPCQWQGGGMDTCTLLYTYKSLRSGGGGARYHQVSSPRQQEAEFRDAYG